MKMDNLDVLSEYKQKVEECMKLYFEERKKDYTFSRDSLTAFERLEEYTLRGGKRLRAALVYHSYNLLGGKNDEIIKVSMVMELIQSYLLMHDDIMDKDNVRRGKPTMHKIYEEEHRRVYKMGEAAHFGNSMGINIGDLASHLAIELLASSSFSDSNKISAIKHLSRQLSLVTFGQMLDVLGTVRDSEEDEILNVYKYKTALYTYETPMYIGALLAGASEKDLDSISRYAIPAGIAFQIQDDILGMFGDEYKLGKSNISDLKEGKQTLLISKAIERSNKKQVQVIMKALGNKNITFEDAGKVREIIISSGSLEYSRTLANSYVNKALEALQVFRFDDGDSIKFLQDIVRSMINRDI